MRHSALVLCIYIFTYIYIYKYICCGTESIAVVAATVNKKYTHRHCRRLARKTKANHERRVCLFLLLFAHHYHYHYHCGTGTLSEVCDPVCFVYVCLNSAANNNKNKTRVLENRILSISQRWRTNNNNNIYI